MAPKQRDLDKWTEDYYALLQVDCTASTAQITRSYRNLAMTLHPDKNPDPLATEKFQALGEAYGVLKDDKLRPRYTAVWQVLQARSNVVTTPNDIAKTRDNNAKPFSNNAQPFSNNAQPFGNNAKPSSNNANPPSSANPPNNNADLPSTDAESPSSTSHESQPDVDGRYEQYRISRTGPFNVFQFLRTRADMTDEELPDYAEMVRLHCVQWYVARRHYLNWLILFDTGACEDDIRVARTLLKKEVDLHSVMNAELWQIADNMISRAEQRRLKTGPAVGWSWTDKLLDFERANMRRSTTAESASDTVARRKKMMLHYVNEMKRRMTQLECKQEVKKQERYAAQAQYTSKPVCTHTKAWSIVEAMYSCDFCDTRDCIAIRICHTCHNRACPACSPHADGHLKIPERLYWESRTECKSRATS